ncbi:hypothetical protein BH09MYX1_BH09MYX1_34380 [soil metagenome]
MTASKTGFAVAGALTTRAFVRDGMTPAVAIALAEQHHTRADVAVERLMQKDNPFQMHAPVCAEGCAYCCHQSVPVCAPEAIWLVHHLHATRAPEDLAKLAEHLKDVSAQNLGLASEASRHRDVPCAFLTLGTSSCSIHEVRPGPCRAFNSVNVGVCIEAFTGTSDTRTVELNQLQHRSIQEAWLGILAGLRMSGLEHRVVDIADAAHLLLTRPDTATRWAAGENVFAEVESPRMRAVNASYAPILDRIVADTMVAEASLGGVVASATVPRRTGLVKLSKKDRKKR